MKTYQVGQTVRNIHTNEEHQIVKIDKTLDNGKTITIIELDDTTRWDTKYIDAHWRIVNEPTTD